MANFPQNIFSVSYYLLVYFLVIIRDDEKKTRNWINFSVLYTIVYKCVMLHMSNWNVTILIKLKRPSEVKKETNQVILTIKWNNTYFLLLWAWLPTVRFLYILLVSVFFFRWSLRYLKSASIYSKPRNQKKLLKSTNNFIYFTWNIMYINRVFIIYLSCNFYTAKLIQKYKGYLFLSYYKKWLN